MEVDTRGRFIAANEQVCRILGYRPDEIVGKTVHEITAPEDRPWSDQLNAELRECRRDRLDCENRYLKRDGSALWVHVTASAICDPAGRPLRFIGTVKEITHRKQAEAMLREQAHLAHLRADATQAPQQSAAMPALMQSVAALLVARLDAAFARVWALDPTAQILELQASAGLYTHLDGAHSRVPVGQLKIGRIAQERWPLVTNQVIGDPHIPGQDWARREGLVAFAGFPLLLEGRLLGVVAIFARHPLSPAAVETFGAVAGALAQALGRKQAEAEVAALNERLAADLAAMERLHQISIRFARQDDLPALLGAILDAALAITRADQGHVQLLNPASEELGIAVQRGYDQPFIEYFSHIHTGTAACGTAAQTRQCVIVEDITLSPLFLAEPRALQLMLEAGVRAVVCTPLMAHTGQLVGVLSAHFALPHRASDRDLRLLDLLARQAADFVAHAQAQEALLTARQELARANEDLERRVQQRTANLRETVAELETFSYSLSHDMRAPLRAIQSYTEIALQQCGDSVAPQTTQFLQNSIAAARRMDRLIQDMLGLTRLSGQQIQLTTVNPEVALRQATRGRPEFHPPHAQLHIQTPLLPTLAHEALLAQCLVNLLDNAVKFVSPGVQPRVRIWTELRNLQSKVQQVESATAHPPSPQQSVNPPIDPQVIRLWIADNGIGIQPRARQKIFGIFQRLHSDKEYAGTGIGLAIVQRAVEKMGGHVGLDSEPGKGSHFWIELPKPPAGQGAAPLEQAA